VLARIKEGKTPRASLNEGNVMHVRLPGELGRRGGRPKEDMLEERGFGETGKARAKKGEI